MAKIKLKVSDLRCDRYLQDSLLVLVLRDEESGREILLPVSDYEFRCIKNLVLKKEFSSYIDNLSKSFFFTKNELVIQNEEIKSKLTFNTLDNFTQEIILPPIESVLYCAGQQVNIVIEEDTFEEVLKLDRKSRKKELEDVECYEKQEFLEKKESDTFYHDGEIAPVAEIKDSNVNFSGSPKVLYLDDNQRKILSSPISKDNVQNYSNEDLILLLKNYLSAYDYENVILIQEELNSRNIDFWHEICEEDFL